MIGRVWILSDYFVNTFRNCPVLNIVGHFTKCQSLCSQSKMASPVSGITSETTESYFVFESIHNISSLKRLVNFSCCPLTSFSFYRALLAKFAFFFSMFWEKFTYSLWSLDEICVFFAILWQNLRIFRNSLMKFIYIYIFFAILYQFHIFPWNTMLI